jgi:hypothetical protein
MPERRDGEQKASEAATSTSPIQLPVEFTANASGEMELRRLSGPVGPEVVK